jgi:hypothetical protein
VATLSHVDGRRRVALESEHTIGRSPECRLTIAASYVSTHHARIQWWGAGWEVRDLGSTNGTWINEEPIRSGECRVLALGDVLTFGRADERWLVEDLAAPMTLLIPLEGGPPVAVEGELWGLPSADNPVATLFRDGTGGWSLERGDGPAAPLLPSQVVEIEGRTYRFSPAEVRSRTVTPGLRWELAQLRLVFAVTRNEEHVEIQVRNGQPRLLPARAHNYTLLYLARRRIADAEGGHPPTGCGWVEKEEVLRALSILPAQLNLEIFRIRQQFAELGVVDSSQIVQRRPTTREVRIGAEHLEVRTL